MENKIVIGLIGRICAGKGTVSEHLEKKYGATVLSYSEPLRDILRIINQDVTRENIQKLSLALRTTYGEIALSKMIRGQAEKKESKILVLDPIRRSQDIHAFEDCHFVTLGVTRDDKARYESMKERNREKNDEGLTWEQFFVVDNAETEQQIEGLLKEADYLVPNDGSIEELLTKVDQALESIIKKGAIR